MNINSPYFLYMAEAEGIESITNTRQTHIEAAIKDFARAARAGYNINDDGIQTKILKNHNINDVTKRECEYIAKKVKRII